MLEIKKFIPFFVADRQASLKILSGLSLSNGKRIGIMTHANTHKNFQQSFKTFPCVNPNSCAIIGNVKCKFDNKISYCEKGKHYKKSTYTICDSGVFTKEGCTIPNYKELFRIYDNLSVNFGLIIDFIKDSKRTVTSAQTAMDCYKNNNWKFKLIGVAQGKNISDYINCYKKLQGMGYEYIGIGGMLQKKKKSARYVYVRNESLLNNILAAIRSFDLKGNVFALGCYSPTRQHIFTQYSVFGSDYKGWIFQYKGLSPKRGNEKAQNNRYEQVRKFINDNVLIQNQNWKKNKLIIISCSKTKKKISEKISAIELYDGPIFRMLRKRLPNFDSQNDIDIIILSSKYGLIRPLDKIQYYDQKMSLERIEKLKAKVLADYCQLVPYSNYESVLVNMGINYLKPIQPILDKMTNTKITILRGPIGYRLHETKRWIEKNKKKK